MFTTGRPRQRGGGDMGRSHYGDISDELMFGNRGNFVSAACRIRQRKTRAGYARGLALIEAATKRFARPSARTCSSDPRACAHLIVATDLATARQNPIGCVWLRPFCVFLCADGLVATVTLGARFLAPTRPAPRVQTGTARRRDRGHGLWRKSFLTWLEHGISGREDYNGPHSRCPG